MEKEISTGKRISMVILSLSLLIELLTGFVGALLAEGVAETVVAVVVSGLLICNLSLLIFLSSRNTFWATLWVALIYPTIAFLAFLIYLRPEPGGRLELIDYSVFVIFALLSSILLPVTLMLKHRTRKIDEAVRQEYKRCISVVKVAIYFTSAFYLFLMKGAEVKGETDIVNFLVIPFLASNALLRAIIELLVYRIDHLTRTKG